MASITLDEYWAKLFSALKEPTRLYDPSGHFLGRYYPLGWYERETGQPIPGPDADEDDRRRAHEAGGHTLKEIWERLGREIPPS